MVQRHWDKGGTVLMLTVTFPHHDGQAVAELRRKLARHDSGAWYHFLNHRIWRKWRGPRKGGRLDGLIRAIEITFGANGPHPHMHVLLFLAPGTECSEDFVTTARETLQTAWRSAVQTAGIEITPENEEHFAEHGLRIDWTNEKIADYINKWGIEHELTKGHVKKGRNGGLTPFDLLREIARLKRTGLSETRKKYEGWYRDFVNAFHGTRQLYCSNGLRDKLGMPREKSDEELAQEHVEAGWRQLHVLDDGDRERVGRYRAWAELLNCAERGGVPLILHFLERLWLQERRARPPTRYYPPLAIKEVEEPQRFELAPSYRRLWELGVVQELDRTRWHKPAARREVEQLGETVAQRAANRWNRIQYGYFWRDFNDNEERKTTYAGN